MTPSKNVARREREIADIEHVIAEIEARKLYYGAEVDGRWADVAPDRTAFYRSEIAILRVQIAQHKKVGLQH